MTEHLTKLDAWMSERADRTDAWLADQIGKERSFMTKVRRGMAQPSLETAVAIEALTGGAVRPADLLATPAPEKAA